MLERCHKDLAEPLRVAQVVEDAPRLLASSIMRDNHVCDPEDPRIDAPNRTPVGASTAATLATATALRESGPGRQWITPCSATEANAPSRRSGLETSASTVVMSR